jgi:hypothetical protein
LLLTVLLAPVPGFLRILLIGDLFDDMNWPWFHSSAVIHGILIAWPVTTLVCVPVVCFGATTWLSVRDDRDGSRGLGL